MITFRHTLDVDDHNAYLTPNTTSSYLPMNRDNYQSHMGIPTVDSQYKCDDKKNMTEHCSSEEQKNPSVENQFQPGEIVQIQTFPTSGRKM